MVVPRDAQWEHTGFTAFAAETPPREYRAGMTGPNTHYGPERSILSVHALVSIEQSFLKICRESYHM